MYAHGRPDRLVDPLDRRQREARSPAAEDDREFPRADAGPTDRRPRRLEEVAVIVRRVLDAFGPQRCIWASDWPYLRAPYRLDYGTLLRLTEQWFSPDEVRQMMWDAPAKLLGW